MGGILNMKYFGTDGFRGEANVDLTVMHAYKVAVEEKYRFFSFGDCCLFI